MTEPLHFDDIVIGGGSAGCAAAHGLVTASDRRVLLIEAGRDVRTWDNKIPGRVREAVQRFDWGYQSEPDPSRLGRTEGWARGRILGGSSSINGMMFVRGAPSDYDRWAGFQNAGWAWDDVAPVFRAMENSDQASQGRGHKGPLDVRTVKRPHALTRAFIDAGVAAGFPANPDYNNGPQDGVGLAQLSQRRGVRRSAADTFVAEIRDRPNFTLWDDCEVDRLIFDAGTVTHLACRRGGDEIHITADRFILSAGAVGSPKLLLLSGVGDPETLAHFGIAVQIGAPEVGQNMREHPLMRLVYSTTIPSRNPTGRLSLMREGLNYLLHREGLLAGAFEGVGFVRSDPTLAVPDIQLHFLPIGILDPVTHASPVLDRASFTVYVNLSHPQGRGHVSLASADPRDAPRIVPNLLGGGDADIDALARGVQIARRIMGSDPMRALVKDELTPGPGVQSISALRGYVRDHTEIAYHISGTCRMGSDPQAVVDPNLKLNGAHNVWIADASIFPDLISGNTNAACMMIGAKLAIALSQPAAVRAA